MVLGWLAKLNPRRIRFDSCTAYRNYGKKWCATNVTEYNDYIPGHWGLCPKSMECDKLKEPWINKLGSVKHETYGERKIASANKENKNSSLHLTTNLQDDENVPNFEVLN